MIVDFDSLIIALAFLLPGFLTSRLVAARTADIERESSIFNETLSSLLRSFYIQLVTTPIFLFVAGIYLLNNQKILSQLLIDGLQTYLNTRPFLFLLIVFAWLLTAFLLALIFGYKWDLLDFLIRKLGKKSGIYFDDPFSILLEQAKARGDKDTGRYQVWIQAKLKSNAVYQGELVFGGFRQQGLSRELLLANVTSLREKPNSEDEIQTFDFAFLDLKNCESIDVKLILV